MRDSIKWVANRMPKSDDRQLSIMSLGNVAKARFFHSSFPQYSITPLARLDGMTKYLGLGDLNEDGTRNVHFDLNGMGRTVAVPDRNAAVQVHPVAMADPEDKSQVGSSIPGAVSRLNVKVGDTVEKNQTLVTIEAMKMETAITARMSGTVSEILVKEGETVKGGQLILVIK